MEYWEYEKQVENKETFHEFLSLLRDHWNEHHELVRRVDGADTKRRKEGWENSYLPDFLEAMQAWIDDTSSLPPDFPYNHLASILSASVVYE